MADAKVDPRALARELGGDAVAALVRAVLDDRERDSSGDGIDAAARRLAEPVPTAPQWPERVWAGFRGDTGEWGYCTGGPDAMTGWTVLPARLVPLDGSAVVLDRATARRALYLAKIGHRNVDFPELLDTDAVDALDAALAAANAEAGR